MTERNLLVPGAIVLAGAIVAGAVLYIGKSGSGANPAASGDASAGAGAGLTPPAAVANIADDDPSLGSPSAPVTFVEFGDFQCPFCGRFFREAEREVIDTYVKNGKVRFVYRDFAFLGEESFRAAEAAECADEQGKFWLYHDALYTHIWDDYYGQGKNGENVGAFSDQNLNRIAGETGLDTRAFSECFSSRRFRAEVEKDVADGRAAGVTGTPTSFINGRMVSGALPFGQFRDLIEEALAATGK